MSIANENDSTGEESYFKGDFHTALEKLDLSLDEEVSLFSEKPEYIDHTLVASNCFHF